MPTYGDGGPGSQATYDGVSTHDPSTGELLHTLLDYFGNNGASATYKGRPLTTKQLGVLQGVSTITQGGSEVAGAAFSVLASGGTDLFSGISTAGHGMQQIATGMEQVNGTWRPARSATGFASGISGPGMAQQSMGTLSYVADAPLIQGRNNMDELAEKVWFSDVQYQMADGTDSVSEAIGVLQLIAQALTHQMATQGYTVPGQPFITIHAKNVWAMLTTYFPWAANPMGTDLPDIAWEQLRNADSLLSFMLEQAPALAWQPFTPTGLLAEYNEVWAPAVGNQSLWYRCIPDDDIMPGQLVAPGGPSAVGFPGLSGVTLAAQSVFNGPLNLAQVMDGCLLTLTAVPSSQGKDDYPGTTRYPRLGELTFLTDGGVQEERQLIEWGATVFMPKVIAHPTGVIVRCKPGAAGVLQPFTITAV